MYTFPSSTSTLVSLGCLRCRFCACDDASTDVTVDTAKALHSCNDQNIPAARYALPLCSDLTAQAKIRLLRHHPCLASKLPDTSLVPAMTQAAFRVRIHNPSPQPFPEQIVQSLSQTRCCC